MKLNADILEAVRKAIEYYGNTSQFAKKIGVAHSTVLFWLSGKTNNISGSIWDNKVRRVLRPFMPARIQDARRAYQTSGQTGVVPLESPVSAERSGHSFPALDFSRMDGVDTTLQSPVSYARNWGSEVKLHQEWERDTTFVLILDQEKYCPGFPLGTRLLVSVGDYAKDGDIIICKTREPMDLFLCRCQRSETMIRLTPLNPELPVMEWKNQENAEKVFWMFPVREIFIDLKNYRWEGSRLLPAKRDEDIE